MGCLAAALAAGLPAVAQQPVVGGNPAVLTARRVVFDTERGLVTAEGDVEMTRSDRRLLADRLIYDQVNDRVFARGNVVLLEPSGRAFYGNELELTDDLRDGTIEGFGALLGEQIRLAARSGLRVDGSRNILDQATYSPCPVCPGDSPLWQIRAKRAVWDEQTKTVTYTDATFELFGTPIGYTPFFSHPDATVDQKTGFLTPTFGLDTTLGATTAIPYYIALAPNRDVTVTPLIATNTTPLLGLEFRDRQNFGITQLSGSITYTEPSTEDLDDGDSNVMRGHIQGFGRYSLSQEWQTGFDVFWTTDDTYLDRYNISDADLLTNDIYLNRIAGGDFVGLSAYAFETLRPGEDQDNIPIVLPLFETRLRSSPSSIGSRMTFDSSLVALTRSEGLDSRRASSEVGWEMPWVGGIGDLLKVRVSLRGDVYNYDGDPENLVAEDGGTGSAGRIIPRATFDWSWPLVGETAGIQYYLEPAVMATATPQDLNSNSIPNEDSIVFEFDETNLFKPDRFTGYDLVDEGARVAYGLRFGSIGLGVVDISGLVGQSYSPDPSDDFPSGSGVTDPLSDYVGRLDIRPSNYLSARYRFRVDKDNFALRRNDIKASVGPPRLRVDVGYLELTNEPSDFTTGDSREEATVGFRIQPTERLAFGAQFRRDISESRWVSNMFGLLYNHPCLQLLAGIEQDFSAPDGGEEVTLRVRVTFTTLGSLRTGI